MAINLHFHPDDEELSVEISELLGALKRHKAEGVLVSDGDDHWIEIADSNTLLALHAGAGMVIGGTVELSHGSIEEDAMRILPALRELGFTVDEPE